MTPIRILIVDDHPIVRAAYRRVFQEVDDMEVIGEADDGATGVQRALQDEPDVVIMDYSMPVMKGDEATREIMANASNVRVIAVSFQESEGVKNAMLQAGAESYFVKGDDTRRLLALIRGEDSDPPAN